MLYSALGLNRRLYRRHCGLLILVVGLLLQPASMLAAQVYYRYVNDQGVRVLDDSIPPKYAQKGYEIVSLSGEVLKVVAPAPDPEDLARQEANDKARKTYERLSRRYSSVEDIEAAKARKLDTINTNITIVRGNIAGLEEQIANLMGQAAKVERSGREVPESLLQKLEDTRAELHTTKDLLAARLKEYEETAARFDAEMEAYVRGKQLMGSKK